MIPRKAANAGPEKPAQDETPEGASTGNLMSDLRGGGEGVEGLAPRRARRFNSSTMVLLLMLAVSGAALGAMRWKGMSSGMSLKLQQIEYEPPATGGNVASRQQQIMTDLSRSLQNVDGGMDRLPKNPFQFDTAVAAAPLVDAEEMKLRERERQLAEESRKREAKAAEEVESAFAALELHGVLAGRIPVARINGKLVRVGDSVGELFTVHAIHGRSVDLMVNGQLRELKMAGEQPEAKTTPARGPGRR